MCAGVLFAEKLYHKETKISTKIQINSLAALERLIGGDTELEVEIRNSVVQEFTKKHLKNIAEHNVAAATSRIQEEVRKVAEQHFGNMRSTVLGYVWKPSAQIAQTIRDSVEEEARVIVHNKVKEVFDSKDFDNLIQQVVDRRVDVEFNEKIRWEVKKRLDQITKSL